MNAHLLVFSLEVDSIFHFSYLICKFKWQTDSFVSLCNWKVHWQKNSSFNFLKLPVGTTCHGIADIGLPIKVCSLLCCALSQSSFPDQINYH